MHATHFKDDVSLNSTGGGNFTDVTVNIYISIMSKNGPNKIPY